MVRKSNKSELNAYIDKMREELEDRNLTKVAKATGLSYPTIHKFKKTGHISLDSLFIIEMYLLKNKK